MKIDETIRHYKTRMENLVVESRIKGARALANALIEVLQHDDLKGREFVSREAMCVAVADVADRLELMWRRQMR